MLLDKLNLASCWNGFLNEMERKCLTPVWSKDGGTHWWPNTLNSCSLCSLWQNWVVTPHTNGQSLLKSSRVLDHYNIWWNWTPPTHHIFHGDVWSWISCLLLLYLALCKKPLNMSSFPFGALTSPSLAGLLAPSWSSQLSHHPAWCLPQGAQQPLCLQAQALSHLLGSFHHSPSFPCHRPDSTSFYHSPSI